jgi:RNA polymerase sigma factor (sigma-70 family)
MADQDLPSSIRGVLRRLKVKELKHLEDPELLDRYVTARDEAAFTALVGRHGPTVLNVCRRVLRGHDVDDVFQATFLALAKEAVNIRRREALGAWLYEVAYHAALRAKNRSVRSQQVEHAAATAENAVVRDEAVYRDMQQVLDEELHQLPERLRKPLVLVHLLGHVQIEAARELGITDRALRKRLRIGREKLRVGLTRRGVTLTAAALVAALDQAATAGPIAPGLLLPTVDSVLAYTAGQTAAVPAATVSLAMAGVGGWLAGRFKFVALVGIPILATLAFTAAALAPSRPGAVRPDRPMVADAEPDLPPPIAPIRAAGKKAVVSGRVLDADGRPVPGAAVTALVRRPWQSDDRGLHDEVVARGTANADGRYSLVVPADFPTWSTERRITLLAHAAGHAPITGEVSLTAQEQTPDLRLAGTATTAGRLLDSDGGPAADVTLAVVRMGKVAWETPQGARPVAAPLGWPAEVKSDAAGAFRLDGVPADETVWLQVRDDRFALTTFPLRTVDSSAAAPNPGEPVILTGPRLLRGRVTGEDTGRPLAGARVAVVAGRDRQAIDYYSALAADLWTPSRIGTEVPNAEVVGMTDADGRYRLRLPPGGTYQVYVYPPDGGAYLGRRWAVTWAEGESIRERSAVLPAGIELHGQVVEEDGRPVGGACVTWNGNVLTSQPPPKLISIRSGPTPQTDAMLFSNSATITGADGHFRLVVGKHPVMLRGFGPTADYQLCDYGYERCPQCGKEHLRPGEHARVSVDPTAGPLEPARVTLRRGYTLKGSAVGPDGEPIRDGVLICRNIDLPLRKPAPRPLPIRDGTFALPGCAPDRTYPMLLLDAARGLAATVEVSIGPRPTGAAQPSVRATATSVQGLSAKLAPCGTAMARLVDSAGRPLPGHRPSVWFWIPDDRPASEPGDNGPWSNAVDASWVDPLHYLAGPVTDTDGIVTLPALVPGLQYSMTFNDLGPRPIISPPFRVTSGQALRLPDVVATPDPDEEGNANRPPDKAPGETDAPGRRP